MTDPGLVEALGAGRLPGSDHQRRATVAGVLEKAGKIVGRRRQIGVGHEAPLAAGLEQPAFDGLALSRGGGGPAGGLGRPAAARALTTSLVLSPLPSSTTRISQEGTRPGRAVRRRSMQDPMRDSSLYAGTTMERKGRLNDLEGRSFGTGRG